MLKIVEERQAGESILDELARRGARQMLMTALYPFRPQISRQISISSESQKNAIVSSWAV